MGLGGFKGWGFGGCGVGLEDWRELAWVSDGVAQRTTLGIFFLSLLH